MINRKIKDRIDVLNKKIRVENKPNLVFINKNKKGWDIIEHYYKPKYQVSYKNYFYNDYNDYLNKVDLDNTIPVIVNSLYYEN